MLNTVVNGNHWGMVFVEIAHISESSHKIGYIYISKIWDLMIEYLCKHG